MSDETQNPNQPPIQEPSVLDYLKSLFRFGKGERIQLPDFAEEEKPSAISDQRSAVSSQPSTISNQLEGTELDNETISQPATFKTLPLAFTACVAPCLAWAKIIRAAADNHSLGDRFLHYGVFDAGWGDLSRRMDSRTAR